jgi:histone H2B
MGEKENSLFLNHATDHTEDSLHFLSFCLIPKQLFLKMPSGWKITASKAPNTIHGKNFARKSRKTFERYDIYLFKIFRERNPDMIVSSHTMSVMNSLMNDIFERIASEAKILAHISKRSTITHRDIQTAVRLLLPGQLARNAVSEGSQALAKYTR